MFNSTEIATKIMNMTSESDVLTYQARVFFPSIVTYWLFQFILTSFLGVIFVRKDIEKFWAIFIFTQLIGGVILFFIFYVPILPQLLDKILAGVI